MDIERGTREHGQVVEIAERFEEHASLGAAHAYHAGRHVEACDDVTEAALISAIAERSSALLEALDEALADGELSNRERTELSIRRRRVEQAVANLERYDAAENANHAGARQRIRDCRRVLSYVTQPAEKIVDQSNNRRNGCQITLPEFDHQMRLIPLEEMVHCDADGS